MEEAYEATKEDIRQYNRIVKSLIKKRGEIIHWLTEIESELDELIVYNFIKEDQKSKFFDILLWEDFRLSTKIKLFNEMELPKKFKDEQKKLVKNLEYLSSIRNKFAHRTFVYIFDFSYLIDKKRKAILISDKFFKQLKKKAVYTENRLSSIWFAQTGTSYRTSNTKKASFDSNELKMWKKYLDSKKSAKGYSAYE